MNGGRERGEPLPEPFTFEGDVFRLPPPGDSYRQGHAVAAVFSAADLDASAGLAMAFHHAESTFDYDREALIAQLRRRYFADEAARTSSAAPRID